MMNNSPHNPLMTLESIALRKGELLKQIQEQKLVMTGIAKDLFAPLAPDATKGNAWMRTFNTGMALFDGVMLGIKLMRKFRKMMHRN